MSYILDALKKADAEREREAAAVPDLYAQADAERGARAAARWPAWAIGLLGAGALALAVVAWRWFGAAPIEQVPAVASVAPAMPAVLPPAVAAPTPAPVALTPPLTPPLAPPVAVALPDARPAPAAQPPTPLPRSVTAPPAPSPAPAPKTAAAAPARLASAASVPNETRLPTLAELPPTVRGQLPALAVGGSMYSPNPASRIVILNGQVFREGDQPLEGLAIERIGLKSTVLVYRGTRFELRH